MLIYIQDICNQPTAVSWAGQFCLANRETVIWLGMAFDSPYAEFESAVRLFGKDELRWLGCYLTFKETVSQCHGILVGMGESCGSDAHGKPISVGGCLEDLLFV